MSLCREMMPPWEMKAEMKRLAAENERLGRDYQTARDAHDKLLLENDRLRAALEEIVKPGGADDFWQCYDIARAALEQEKGGQ